MVDCVDIILIEELIDVGIIICSVGVIIVLGVVQYQFKIVVVQVQVYIGIVGLF